MLQNCNVSNVILDDKNRLIFLNIHELTLIWFCWHVHIHKMSPCRCLSFGSVFFLFFNSLVSQPNRVIRRYPGINICGKFFMLHKAERLPFTSSLPVSLAALISSRSILSQSCHDKNVVIEDFIPEFFHSIFVQTSCNKIFVHYGTTRIGTLSRNSICLKMINHQCYAFD